MKSLYFSIFLNYIFFIEIFDKNSWKNKYTEIEFSSQNKYKVQVQSTKDEANTKEILFEFY